MKVTQPVAREAMELWGGGRGKQLLLIAVPWGLLVGARMIYPVLLPDIQDSYGLSLTAAGLLITILWLSGAIGQLPGGVLADRYSERRVMAMSAVFVAIATSIIVSAPGVFVLFAATGLWGLSHSLYPIARITILTDIFPDQIGSAVGVTMATGDLGQTVLPPAAGAIAVTFAWQLGFGFVIPLLVLSGLLIWVLLPDQSSNELSVGTLSFESARTVLIRMRRPDMTFVTIILLFYLFMWQSFTAFYPTYLITTKGLTSSMAAVLFGLFFATGIIVKPLAGAAYDRIGVRGALISVLVGPIAGLALLPFVAGFWSLAIVTALVSTMLGTGAITQSSMAEMFPRDVRGSGLGTVRSLTFTLGSTGPLLFGVLADHGYFDQAYHILAALIIIIILYALRTTNV